MTTLYFLEAAVPLTKTITPTHKLPYPLVKNFTGHAEEVTTPVEFFKAVQKHAAKNHCLLKGSLTRPLTNEPRANTTRSNDETEWVCLDFDRFETHNIEEQLAAMDLGDVSYVLQYSASHGLPENEGTVSAHVFMLLSEAVQAPALKSWLMGQNLSLFRDELRLSRDKNQLSWPLDITTCQNDKLLYIAKPVFKGCDDPLEASRIQFITKPLPTIPVERLAERHMDALKNEARDALNKLRKAEGLKPRVAGTSWVSGKEVLNKPTVASVTGIKDAGDWIRLNLNGGDSWAYCHPKENFELIYDFKSDSWYKTKELLPEYYQDLKSQQEELNATPTEEGDLILAFRDLRTASYFNGFWNPGERKLELYPAKNETQLDHWMRSHGRTIGDFIPVWDMSYNPREDWTVDEEAHRINTFQTTPYFYVEPQSNDKWPSILKIICHMLGEDKAERTELVEHFLNWFAAIFQRQFKPLTAFVCHGVEGCVAGDTLITYGRGNRIGGRPLTIKEAYEKFNGLWKADKVRKGKPWDTSLPTRCRAVKDNMTVGFHEVMRIVQSGEQQLYKLTDEFGNSIRVTHEHPIMRPDGTFTKLRDLKPGDFIVRRGEKNVHTHNKHGRNKSRVTIHSIPFHPYAWRHLIAGKNYKRSHKARLVFEADMNGLTLDEFVNILRNDESRAKRLRYLDQNLIVHHIDEDPSNDALENLTTVDKLNHDQHHAKETGLGTVLTKAVRVKSIVKDKVEMTYDMTMKMPYHNYEANGFIVSNTGKGYFANKIAAVLLGHTNFTSKTVSDIEDTFNAFLANKLFCFVDEVDVDDFREKGRVTARLRNWITEPTFSIRDMRKVAADMPNYVSFLFSSNRPQPVFIPQSDRRYNVGNFQAHKLPRPDDNAVENELMSFAEFLAAYKVNRDKANTPLHTEERQNIQNISLTSAEETARTIINGDLGSLWLARTDERLLRESGVVNAVTQNAQAYNVLIDRLIQEALVDTNGVITRDELLVLFQYNVGGVPTSPNKFTSFLRHKSITTKRLRKNGELVYGMEVKWKLEDWFMEELRGQKQTKMRRVK